jgi:hypothetical protein
LAFRVLNCIDVFWIGRIIRYAILIAVVCMMLVTKPVWQVIRVQNACR